MWQKILLQAAARATAQYTAIGNGYLSLLHLVYVFCFAVFLFAAGEVFSLTNPARMPTIPSHFSRRL